MGALAVIFSQPALCNFTCFVQGSEQIKSQYFCPVRPVESFDKGILCWLAGPEKFQHHTMLFCPLCQRQQDQLRTVIHPHLQRISAVCHDPVQHSHDPLRRDIQINFDRQCFAVKIIHHVEGPEASAAYQRIVHKIDGPALVHRLWRHQRNRIAHWQVLFSLTAKIQFQQEVNPVNALMVPGVALPAKDLKKPFISVSRIAFSRHGQRHNYRLIPSRIRLITKYRPAQRQYPACLT